MEPKEEKTVESVTDSNDNRTNYKLNFRKLVASEFQNFQSLHEELVLVSGIDVKITTESPTYTIEGYYWHGDCVKDNKLSERIYDKVIINPAKKKYSELGFNFDDIRKITIGDYILPYLFFYTSSDFPASGASGLYVICSRMDQTTNELVRKAVRPWLLREVKN